MAKIENHKYTIDEAFRECFYIVPDYQREYVWTDKEVHQLLDDINEQLDDDGNKEYFIGTVLVSPAGQKGHYDVIDGQQRLTTFFLLLCALRHRFKGMPQEQALAQLMQSTYTDKNGIPQTQLKLEPRYENAGEVVGLIAKINDEPSVVNAAVRSSGIKSFGSLKNLLNTYTTLYQYLLDNYESPEDLAKYWGHLANNVVFIQISTDVSSALKIFETINERGLGLNPMDLLKNLLFTQVDPDEFTKLKDEWKKITSPLEKNKEKPLRFLRYFIMANYRFETKRGKKKGTDSIVREDEIYDWFRKKENAALCNYVDKPYDFVRKIALNVDWYIDYADGRGNDSKPSIAMENLKHLTGGAFSLHYVLLLAASPLPKAMFDYLVTQLESFLFYFIFTKTPTRILERNFSIWADEVREIAQLKDAKKQIAEINTFVAERFQKNMDAKQVELEDALRRLTENSVQQYRLRYFLTKLGQHIDMAYKGTKTVGSLSEYKGVEIEHILPQTPEPDLRKAFNEENPGAEYDLVKSRVGNLTLLEKPINIVASNDYYAAKRKEFAKSKYYLTSSLNELTQLGVNNSITRINEKLKAFDEWTAEAIDERQKLLIELGQHVWKTSPLAEKS